MASVAGRFPAAIGWPGGRRGIGMAVAEAHAEAAATRDDLAARLAVHPRIRLAHLPTPLDPCPRLAEAIGVRALYIKRDDLTGLAFGGNKTRHLEFTFAEILKSGADTVVAGAYTQSNWCRQITAAARKNGLAVSLVLIHGVKGPRVQGNLLLDRLMGADVTVVDIDSMEKIQPLLDEKARALGGGRPQAFRDRPLRPGSAGARCARLRRHGDRAGCPVRGGGDRPHPGLHLRRQQHPGRPRHRPARAGPPGARGVDQPDPLGGAPRARHRAGGHGDGARARPQSRDRSLPTSLQTRITSARTTACSRRRRARPSGSWPETEGIILDPVYSGKAMAGLIDHVRRGKVGADETVVFVHTGGMPALFAYAEDLIDDG